MDPQSNEPPVPDRSITNGDRSNFPSLVDSVDQLFGTRLSFLTVLRDTFINFQSPPPSSTIPPESLLSALQAFLQNISKELNPKAAKLFLRRITLKDIESIAKKYPSLELDQPIDAEKFYKVTRKIMIHIALDRGKRLGVFVLSGIIAFDFVKGILKRLPVVGQSVDIVGNILFPTIIMGPLLGIAGALYMERE